MQLLNKTKSVCPRCSSQIKANVIEQNGKVYMLKKCKIHGKFKILLSNNSHHYSEMEKLYQLYEKKKQFPEKKYFLLYLTPKCNLNCPICFVNTKKNKYSAPSLNFIRKIVMHKKKCVINLFGGEPTMRTDLSEIIKIIKESCNEPLLYTNGIKISNFKYLKKLRDCGLDEVHLQFDGFNDQVYEKVRGRNLIKIKEKALNNLRKINMPTVLEVTILKGVNEKEMADILYYGMKNEFIKGIVFRSYCTVGKNVFKHNFSILVDEMLDSIENQTRNLISKNKVYSFQKILLFFSYIFSIKNFHCSYNIFFLIPRDKNNKSTHNLFNFDVIDRIDLNKKMNKISMLLLLIRSFKFNLPLYLSGCILFIRNYFGFPIKVLKFNLPKKILILEFASLCNPYTFDFSKISQCPGKPIIPNKSLDSLAMHNLALSRNCTH